MPCGNPKAILRSGDRHIQIALIGVNFVKAEIDRKLFRRCRLGLAEQPVRERVVMAIGGNPLLEQTVDRVWEIAEIDSVGV